MSVLRRLPKRSLPIVTLPGSVDVNYVDRVIDFASDAQRDRETNARDINGNIVTTTAIRRAARKIRGL